MSKFNFTSILRTSLFLFACFAFSMFPQSMNAQCSLGCTGTLQVSLDMSCQATITPEMILNDQTTSCMGGVFIVQIEDQFGNVIPGSPVVTDAHKNQTLYAKVIDTVSGNSCWGNIVVEDKIPPQFTCVDPVGPFYCYDLNSFNPEVTDNCDNDPEMILLSDIITANNCSTSFVDDLEACGFFPDANGTSYADALADVGLVAYVLKIHTRSYKAIDDCGNESAPCVMKLVVEGIPDLTEIVCPPNLSLSDDTHLHCDGGWVALANGNPAPNGTFRNKFPINGEITTASPINSSMTDYEDIYTFTYSASNGACETVTLSDNGAPGIIEIRMADGTVIDVGSDLTVSLCDDTQYILKKAVFTMNGSIPFTYELTLVGPGEGGCLVPESPYFTDGTNLVPLFPDPDIYCNLLTTFSDIDLGNIGCVRKIMRTWTILEWSCSSPQRTTTCTQIIEIADDEGPQANCPSDVTISTNAGGYTCGATYTPPVLTLSDNCCDASDLTMDISWSAGGVPLGAMEDYAGAPIQLGVGANVITYTVYDCCYNSNTCSYTVTVEDNTPPVAVCDQFTVVSLSSDGMAHIYASVFDDGSYDDCQLIATKVKRMDEGANCGLHEDTFEDAITVCCNDIGTNVMVQFRVYDSYLANGEIDFSRYNECMVEIEVQDKLAPSISCPPTVNLNCDDTFDVNGDLVAQFGDYTVLDNCGFTVEDIIVQNNLDQCNQGTLTRRIRVTDAGGRSSQCVQTITITNDDPFYVDPSNVCNSPNDDVQFPADFNMEGCADPTSSDFHPDVTGFPLLSEDQCDLVGLDWDDQIFPFNSNGNNQDEVCFKILRTWTILDWCQQNHPNNLDADPTNDVPYVWTCNQIIKVNNSVAPEITSDCGPKSTCTFDQDCNNGFIELTATATDDCTDVLDWWADIDAFSDGSFDINLSGTGETANASGNYPVGTHIIFWSFKDKCGNVTTCSQEFTIISCKAPTAYCINGLATDLMPVDTNGDGTADDGMIEIWANDFDNGSFHQCGYDVTLSFSADIFDTAVTFTCATLGDQNVSIYVTAVDASGNPLLMPDGSLIQSLCNTFINIQDNMGVCGSGSGSGGGSTLSRISGNISTELDESLVDAEVHLGDGVNVQMTDADGMYAFPDMPNGNVYEINPAKNTDPMNGVSTLDLVLIQKHILQLELLNSPYKYIAADVNHDEKVSAIDLIELRKLILGINIDFTNNESWRFVDEDYQFIDASNPLDELFPESYDIPSLNSDMVIDFVAVKVGDVNNSVTANANSVVTANRSGSSLALYTHNATFSAGELVTVPVMAAKDNAILGYQFTLDFNSSVVEYQGFNSNTITLSEANFGQQMVRNGQLTTSWNELNAAELRKDDELFSLQFIALADGQLSDIMMITSDITQAEAYNEYKELMDVELQVRSDIKGYALLQNTPNPFSVSTDIAFEIPTNQNVKISIFDVTGKVVQVIKGNFEAGYNSVNVRRDVLNTSGVLYYSLEADEFTATRKMVILK